MLTMQAMMKVLIVVLQRVRVTYNEMENDNRHGKKLFFLIRERKKEKKT